MKNSILTALDLNHFFEVKNFNSQYDGSHTMLEGEFKHPILPKEFLGELQGDWFAKHMDSERKARFEMLSQEIFRLFLPHQPKTVYGKGVKMIPSEAGATTGTQHFVLSKKVEDLTPLPKGRQPRFFQGAYRCLGHVMALSIFLHEIDLSLENICLDFHGRVVKLDGDWTLAHIVNPEQFSEEMNTKIDARLLMDVFFFNHYAVYNWFDLIQAADKKKDISDIIPRDMMNSPAFQNEYFEMLAWIAIMPDDVFYKLIQACIGIDELEYTYGQLIQRKNDLIDSAIQNTRFVEFFLSKNTLASLVPSDLKEHMLQFTLHKDYQLCTAEEKVMFDEKLSINQRQLFTMMIRMQSSPKAVNHSFSSSILFPSNTSLRASNFSTRNLSNLSGMRSNVMTPNPQMMGDLETEVENDDTLTF